MSLDKEKQMKSQVQVLEEVLDFVEEASSLDEVREYLQDRLTDIVDTEFIQEELDSLQFDNSDEELEETL